MLERAVFAILARPGISWMTATRIAKQLDRGQREVAKALANLAQRGVVSRSVEWAGRHVVVVWRYQHGSLR